MAGLLSEHASDLAMAAGGTFPLANGKLEEPEYSTTNWYFSRDEIERNSPSRMDGIDMKKETYFRKSYCTFLQDLGMQLRVPQVTIATAIVMCHRFFLRQSHCRNDKFMVATVCMFLAGKVEETPRPLRDVVTLSYILRNKKDPSAAVRIKQKELLEEQKELVLLGEHLVLTTLEFDMNIHHPYKPLVTAIKRFKIAQNALAQVAWNFVNDGLRTSLCLQFKPHHIAAGAIFLATKFLKVKLPSDGEKVWWQEFGVTAQQLEDVSNQMLELYEQNKPGPSSHRSDPGMSGRACNGSKTEISDQGNPEGVAAGNSASQPSPVLYSKVTYNPAGVDNAETTMVASQPEEDFGFCDSSREDSHSGHHGRKQVGYIGSSEERNVWKGGIYSSTYFSQNRVDSKNMSNFRKSSAAGQELGEAEAGHAINETYMLPMPTSQKVKVIRSPSQEVLLSGQNEIPVNKKYGEKELRIAQPTGDGPRHQGIDSPYKNEDAGKERAPGTLQELKLNSAKDSGDRKRKMRAPEGERFATVKQEVSNGEQVAFRETENTVGGARENSLTQGKKTTQMGQSYFNSRGPNDFQKANLATAVKPFEETANQIEEGEFGIQIQNHVPKASSGRHISPGAMGKAHNLSREQSEQSHFSARVGSHDKKHRHGNSHSNTNSSHHQEFQKADPGIDLHRQKGQIWQERDPKKLRPNHVK